MNRVSVWMIRLALIWFLITVFTGGCLLLAKAGTLSIHLVPFISIHITTAMAGWMVGMILGTGLWMFPRSIRADGRHVRLDGWWQPALVHGGTALWIVGLLLGSHAWIGMILWVAGVSGMIPIFWIRSRKLNPA